MAQKKNKFDNVAAGFMTSPSDQENEIINEIPATKITETSSKKSTNHKLNKQAGRPSKEGLKNVNTTLTMNPEMIERIKILAQDYSRGNFSAFIEASVNSYCKQLGINLSEIKVDPTILNKYMQKQEIRKKKQ